MSELFNIHLISCVLLAFVVMTVLVYFIRPIAKQMGLEDIPGGRKQHQNPTPVIGGLCMFLAFCFALLSLPNSLANFRVLIGAAAILVFVGVLDDLRELSSRSKFMAQIIASLMMIIPPNNLIHSFGNLLGFGPIELGFWSIPVTIFATVAVINAVNMLDGVDGLLGSMSLVQLSLLGWIAFHVGNTESFSVLIVFAAVLFAFLLFNFPFPGRKQAKIFMGDAGSMLLGFLLVWFCIHLTQTSNAAVKPATMLWIISLPLFDTTRLLIKRTLQHGNPLEPGRDHLHHLLLEYGYSKLQVCLLLTALTLVLGVFGLIAPTLNITQSESFFLFLLLFVIYCLFMHFGWRHISKRLQTLKYS